MPFFSLFAGAFHSTCTAVELTDSALNFLGSPGTENLLTSTCEVYLSRICLSLCRDQTFFTFPGTYGMTVCKCRGNRRKRNYYKKPAYGSQFVNWTSFIETWILYWKVLREKTYTKQWMNEGVSKLTYQKFVWIASYCTDFYLFIVLITPYLRSSVYVFNIA